MASMNRSSSSSGNGNVPPEKHEVFISFRGEDTRKGFTSHLNAAFRRNDIRTYMDYNLERGDEISTTLLEAIEDAQLSVIVFSKNYANSKWCLDELLKILECKRSRGQVVLPVFYDIDPSFVRNQIASYAEAFEKHEQRFRHDLTKVQKWRDALTEAASYSGWDCTINRMESELVEEIVKDVLEKLNRVYVGDLDEQIAKYEQLAQLQNEYARKLPSIQNFQQVEITKQRIVQLQMERNLRMLRLTPDMVSEIQQSSPPNNYRFF
ncbi:disease resistance protein RPV1-like [Prosopis cineraria]|uniref:disease resistance protein RPV1-like n=1 Tax=Prosopis cineraria TaxID=364024 RepID=UPI00240EA46F|nr:disease resistance protein RPV1-like [Prosopis cineraria]